MKKYLAVFCLFICVGASAQYNKSDIRTYIQTYSDVAVRKMQEHKIPASITLAQGILESGAGTSDLAVLANNHFGIKCHKSWNGKTYHKDDDKKDECFRKYKTALESFEDHSQILKASRYANLFTLEITDYKGWAHGLKKAGYATHPEYANRLIKLIEDYDLAAYDREQQPALATNNNEQQPVPNQYAENSTAESSGRRGAKPTFEQPQQQPTQEAGSTSYIPKKTSYKEFSPVEYPYTMRSVYRNNGTYFVVAQRGDTYFSIAKDVQLGMGELKIYNDIPFNKYEPAEGEMVYLKRKRKYAEHNTHILRRNETLRDVAQLYGCRLKTIYKLNNLNNSEIPIEEGIRLILKK